MRAREERITPREETTPRETRVVEAGKRDAHVKDTHMDSRKSTHAARAMTLQHETRLDSNRRVHLSGSHSRLGANARRMASTSSCVTGLVSVAFGVCMKMMDVSQVALRYCAFLVCCAPSK